MKFLRVTGTVDLESALVTALSEALLTNEQVVWLVPGGSNIAVAVKVMAKIEAIHIKNLTVLLTDERYGEPRHADSNYFQMHQQGFIERGATFDELLVAGVTLEDTVLAASALYEKTFAKAKYVIGFFGMGADGHVAGILPNSPAATHDDTWFAGYDAGQFKRMTMTPFAIKHISLAIVGAFGAEKLTALESLQNTALPIAEQPAQILKSVPEAIVFNDLIGDKI